MGRQHYGGDWPASDPDAGTAAGRARRGASLDGAADSTSSASSRASTWQAHALRHGGRRPRRRAGEHRGTRSSVANRSPARNAPRCSRSSWPRGRPTRTDRPARTTPCTATCDRLAGGAGLAKASVRSAVRDEQEVDGVQSRRAAFEGRASDIRYGKHPRWRWMKARHRSRPGLREPTCAAVLSGWGVRWVASAAIPRTSTRQNPGKDDSQTSTAANVLAREASTSGTAGRISGWDGPARQARPASTDGAQAS